MTQAKEVNLKKTLELEIYWWLFSGLVAALILVPVFLNTNTFAFYLSNLIFVIAFLTLARYIFLLPYTWIARKEMAKVVVVFLCIPIVFFAIQELNLFQTFLDENGVEALVGADIPLEKRNSLSKYIHSEMLLFAVGTIISGILLPFRLLLSVWRGRNTGGI
jgi:dipeptide/tripeptide permease